MKPKKRADSLLLERGLIESREKAQAAIEEGRVFVDRKPVDKPGRLVESNANIHLTSPDPFVSRGGLKLDHALKVFDVDCEGKTAMDVGSSTGGFVDCLLQNGVKKVFAVDVGYGQLHWSLRQDHRVEVIERTNIRNLEASSLSSLPQLITVDVSFISLSKIFARLWELLDEPGDLIALVKPQFEAGRGQVGKGGIVKDPAIHRQVLTDTALSALEKGFQVMAMAASPITGTKGNREFLMHLKKQTPGQTQFEVTSLEMTIESAVADVNAPCEKGDSGKEENG